MKKDEIKDERKEITKELKELQKTYEQTTLVYNSLSFINDLIGMRIGRNNSFSQDSILFMGEISGQLSVIESQMQSILERLHDKYQLPLYEKIQEDSFSFD